VNAEIQFGTIDHVVFFGGGQLLLDVAGIARRMGFRVDVVTSERHGRESCRDGCFADVVTGLGYPLLTATSLGAPEVLSLLDERTLGLSFGAAWIFKEDFISRLGGRLVNCHNTPLPQYRGGASYSWMIMNGETRGASLLHLIDCCVDTGDVLLREDYFYPETCQTPADYQAYSCEVACELLERFLSGVRQGEVFERQRQHEAKSVYLPRLFTELCSYVDFSWTGEEIVRFVSAFDEPYAGARCFLAGEMVRMKGARLLPSENYFHPYQAGLVYRIGAREICIAARGRAFSVARLMDASGDSLYDRIQPGDRLYTPGEVLEQAKQKRVVFTPSGGRIK